MKFLWLLLLCAWASPAALQSKELGELVHQLRAAIVSRDVGVVKASLASLEAFGDKLVCPTCPPASKKSKSASSSSSSSSLSASSSTSSSSAAELERLRMIALFDECTEDLRHAKLVLDSSKRHQDKEVEKLRQVQSGVGQLMDSLRVMQGDLMKAQLETSERELELDLIHQQAVTAAKIERDIAEIQQHARVNYETGELEMGRGEDASGLLLLEELTKKTRHLPIDAAVMHANPALLLDFVILLAASALGGALARAAAGRLLPIPHVVGFLIAGALVGPNGLNLVTAVIEVDTLAQFGSVFFMLGLGLEFSLKEQLRFRAMSMGGTLLFTAMIAVTIQLCTLVFSGVVESPLEGLLLGMSVSLSSLSIVLDYLRLHKLLQSTPAKVMIGILGFQGFLVGIFFSIPLALTSRQQLDEGAETTAADAFASVCASVLCAVLTAMFAFGTARYVLPKLLSPTMAVDMYLLCVVAISMLMALITVSLGLTLDLGAFFAGLMLSEVDAGSNRTKELVLPLSSVFGSLLFASLGMMLNVEFFWKNLGEICFIAAQLVGIKLCMVGVVTRLFDFSFRTAIFCAVGLCHVGELSLLFSSKLQAYGLLSRRAYLLFLAATCVTLTSAPLVMRVLAHARVADMINRMDNVSSGSNNNSNTLSSGEEPPLAVEATVASDPNSHHHGDFTSATWRRKL